LVALSAYLLWPKTEPVQRVPTLSSTLETADQRWVIVYVSGAVAHPGLYRVAAGQRVSDALVLAGGLKDADTSCLPNLAARVKDGKQIAIPSTGRCTRSGSKKLDINRATKDQLLKVPGMDPDLAAAIIGYRDSYGGFVDLTELKSALGIDANLYKRLARSLTVS
jgi:competence protein ComEA